MNLEITQKVVVSAKGEEPFCPVHSVNWTTDGYLVSCGDDKKILKWNVNYESSEIMNNVGTYTTTLSTHSKSLSKSGDAFAVGCSDGTIRLISNTGREEKKIMAHTGSVLKVLWSHDGMSLLSTGEDGQLKLWSRNGSIRSNIITCTQPIYHAAWSPTNEEILITSGKSLLIKPIESTQKSVIQWEAHHELILCVDWNPATNYIISSSEDCRYCIWNNMGKNIYASRYFDHVITTVAFSPNGEYAAVGSYNMILLTDTRGSIYYHGKLDESGSLFDISWSYDSTQLAAAGGSGCVIFANITGQKYETAQYQITIINHSKLHIRNIAKDYYEDLYVGKDRIIEVCLNEEWLIVTTATQCYIYHLSNLNTPYIIDLRVYPFLIKISKSNFLLLDMIEGIHIYSFEGKSICNPRHQNFRPDLCTHALISLSSTKLMVVDSFDRKSCILFDSTNGRELCKYTHINDIISISLLESTTNFLDNTQVIVVIYDISHDLSLVSLNLRVQKNQSLSILYKLQSNIESYKVYWKDNSIVAVGDGILKIYHYPSIVFVDKDLLPVTVTQIDVSKLGREYHIIDYTGTRIHIRTHNGSIEYHNIPIYHSLFYYLCMENQWTQALLLCRTYKQSILWGLLASISYTKKQYEIADIAFCEINDIAKAEYVRSLKNTIASTVKDQRK